MKKIFSTLFSLSLVLLVDAQYAQDYLKAADNYYRKGDYFSAAQYYEKYLSGGSGTKTEKYNPYVVQTASKTKMNVSSREEAVYKMAESYHNIRYHTKAEPVYRESLRFDPVKFPLAKYKYATTLRALEKFDSAEIYFNEFLSEYKTDDEHRTSAEREVASLRFIREQLNRKDLPLFTIHKPGGMFNTTGGTYAPMWGGANVLYFTSTRADSSVDRDNIHDNRIYEVSYSNGSATSVGKTAIPQDDDLHQGVISFTPDGNTMFLTRWSIGEGKKNARLFSSRRSASNWSKPEPVSGLNSDGYNSQQPFVMPDGKSIIYSSDRPGGNGGFDLYMAELDASGNPGASVNLGSVINTSRDDQAPFYHAPSGSLIFSTNGRVGMGGFDFFQSKGTPGNWETPVNMGYPVNSIKDDLYFVSRGGAKNILEDVLFSSDRSAVCCLELFSMNKVRPLRQVEGLVVDCETNSPVGGVTIRVVDTVNNTTVYTQNLNRDGRYSFTLEDFQPLKITASALTHSEASIHFNAPANAESLGLSLPAICITRVKVPIVMRNVYYEFAKSELMVESFPSLDDLVRLLNENPTMVIELGAHTDNIGSESYNQRLSLARAQSVVDYLVSKGIDKSRLKAKGYGATQPVAPNQNPDGTDNPENRQKNRRTEFKIISE